MAEKYKIVAKVKTNPTLFATSNDFALGECSVIEPEIVIQNPNITLYSLDLHGNRAIFVETPESVNLLEYPFFYQAQYANAVNAIHMSFETMHRVAKEIQPFNEPVILIHSVGRSGSTLLSRVFKSIDGIVSISEPDAFTNVIAMGDLTERASLITSASRLLLNSFSVRENLAWAIKFRSFCTEIADETHRLIPNSRSIFLYRNLGDWVRSSARAFNIFDPSATQWMFAPDPLRPKLIPLLLADPNKSYTDYTPAEFITLMWLSAMQRFHEISRLGGEILPISYDEMVKDPMKTLHSLFTYAGLDTELIAHGLSAFETDSQAGSPLAKTVTGDKDILTKKEYEEISNTVQRITRLNPPSLIDPIYYNAT